MMWISNTTTGMNTTYVTSTTANAAVWVATCHPGFVQTEPIGEEDVAIDAVLAENEMLTYKIAELEKEMATLMGLTEAA